MLDYIEKYFADIAALDAEFRTQEVEKRRELIANKRGAARAEGEEEFNIWYSAADKLREARKQVARLGMLAGGDKFVTWMVSKCSEYPGHVDEVLRVWPTDVDTIRRIAQENGWCGEFDRLLAEGIRVGAIDDGRSRERREFDNWLRRNFSFREHNMSAVHEYLDRIVAAEIAKAKTKPKGKGKDAATADADTPVLVAA